MTIGILGGTFDPFHHGHLRLAIECRERLQLQSVNLVPLNHPPHRSLPSASAMDRLAMLKHAINDYEFLQIDKCELQREEVSYSIDTVRDLRQRYSDESLCLILGRDAFNSLESWKDWQKLIEFVHIVVVERPGDHINVSTAVTGFIDKHRLRDPGELDSKPCGRLLELQIPLLDISATDIRERIRAGRDPSGLLPQSVYAYIQQHALYQQDHA